MYKITKTAFRVAALGAMIAFSLSAVVALSVHVAERAQAQQAGDVQSLRGDTEIPDDNTTAIVPRQDTQAGSFERAYRQQPPLIPHKIQNYQITRTVNQCMQCHDWPFNVDQGAPKISETHYFNRDGVALDEVSSNRWFCTQCHVIQSDAKELVQNEFTSAIDLD